MNWLDIVLLIIILFFVFRGFKAGLVGAIGALLGVIVGIWAGSNFMDEVAAWLLSFFNFSNQSLANILAFVLIFIVVNIIFSLAVWIINSIFHVIPLINFANKIIGALIGLVGGILFISALVYLLSLFAFSQNIADVLQSSQLATVAVKIAVILKPLIPEAVKSLKSIL